MCVQNVNILCEIAFVWSESAHGGNKNMYGYRVENWH